MKQKKKRNYSRYCCESIQLDNVNANPGIAKEIKIQLRKIQSPLEGNLH